MVTESRMIQIKEQKQMKQKKWGALLGMMAAGLILMACDGDSGNNGTEMEGGSSSSIEFSSSSGQLTSSSGLSNSSVPLSSSAGVPLSSSSVEACTNAYGTNTVTDCRDNQVYKTVTIGTQTWMAENLNYADTVAMPNLAGNTRYHVFNLDSCAKYGRFYTWTGAMNLDSSYQSMVASAVISTPHQGVCPAGWHIPTNAEWTILENAVGDSSAGTVLKSTTGWRNDGNGTDTYGFTALPVGEYDGSMSHFFGDNSFAYFWSATEYANDASEEHAYYRGLSSMMGTMFTKGAYKSTGFSVRCLKDGSNASVQESSSSTEPSSSSVSPSSSSASDSCDFSIDEDVWEFTKGSTTYSYVIDDNDTLTVSINGKVKYTYNVSTAASRQIRYDAAISTCKM